RPSGGRPSGGRPMSRVLVVTADVLRAQLAGPAMRALHIARHLAGENEVRLVTTSPYCELQPDGFTALAAGAEELAEAEAWSEVMVLQGYVTYHHPLLAESGKVLVFDMYDPLHLETLALTRGMSGPGRDAHVRLSVETLNAQLRRADFLVCASERQRDLFIGQLCALGRANPLTYDEDPTLRQLIDVVPFGLPDTGPEHRRPALRGVVPGIGPADDLLIWAGGVYNWFDPLTLIRAVAGLAQRRPSVRLYFMGLRHPNPDVPEMTMATEARALAEELGVAGKHVFFNEGWVDYADRQDYLLEANLGVTMHFDSAETRFAFRTRALDYLWAALPVVTTEGDSFAELVEREGLGLCVPPEDPDALEIALACLLNDRELAEACRARAAQVRERYRWSAVLEPLARFCRQPRRAPDIALPARAGATAEPAGPKAPQLAGNVGPAEVGPAEVGPASMNLAQLAVHHYREGGWAQLADRATRKARRIVAAKHSGTGQPRAR
ncbi:MAG: glycosyltransferase family 4 protein, partial [Acidimicrobiales bacterium]